MNMRHALLAILLVTPAAVTAADSGQMTGRPDHSRQGAHQPGGRMGPGPMGPRGNMPPPDRMFDMIDANHDGSISRQEFMTAHRRMAERRQENRDARGGSIDGHGPR